MTKSRFMTMVFYGAELALSSPQAGFIWPAASFGQYYRQTNLFSNTAREETNSLDRKNPGAWRESRSSPCGNTGNRTGVFSQ